MGEGDLGRDWGVLWGVLMGGLGEGGFGVKLGGILGG